MFRFFTTFVLFVALFPLERQVASGAGSPIWRPAPGVTWQWQLTGKVDTSIHADVYNIDLFDNDARVVADLHAKGRKVVCYMSAGTFEDWRQDAGRFPAEAQGAALDDWPGERWLDIRRIDLLAPIMEARLDLCRAKGFDGVEFDNVDGYANSSGFPLSAAHQLAYNKWLAQAAHARGLAAGLKNDVDQVEQLQPYFEFAINEQCFEYEECDPLVPHFIQNGKAVLHVEYALETDAFCERANTLRFSSMQKRYELDAYRNPCRLQEPSGAGERKVFLPQVITTTG